MTRLTRLFDLYEPVYYSDSKMEFPQTLLGLQDGVLLNKQVQEVPT
jgi:hypothetical protein